MKEGDQIEGLAMHGRIILKMNVREIEYERMEWIHQAQDDSTKVRESGGQLSTVQFSRPT